MDTIFNIAWKTVERSFDIVGRALNIVVRMERTSAGPLVGEDGGRVERLARSVGSSSGRRELGCTRWMRRLYAGMNSLTQIVLVFN